MTERSLREADRVFNELIDIWGDLNSEDLAEKLVYSYEDLASQLEKDILKIVINLIVSEVNERSNAR